MDATSTRSEQPLIKAEDASQPIASTNGVNTLSDVKQQPVPENSKVSDDDDNWHLVGTFKTTTTDIRHYYLVPSKINIDNYVR